MTFLELEKLCKKRRRKRYLIFSAIGLSIVSFLFGFYIGIEKFLNKNSISSKKSTKEHMLKNTLNNQIVNSIPKENLKVKPPKPKETLTENKKTVISTKENIENNTTNSSEFVPLNLTEQKEAVSNKENLATVKIEQNNTAKQTQKPPKKENQLITAKEIKSENKKQIYKPNVETKTLKPKPKIISNQNTKSSNQLTLTLDTGSDLYQSPENEINNQPIQQVKPHKNLENVLKSNSQKNENVIETTEIPSFSLCINLAEKYYEYGNYKKALKWAIYANIKNKEDKRSWIITAKSLYKLGDKEKAIKILKIYYNFTKDKSVKKLIKDISNE